MIDLLLQLLAMTVHSPEHLLGERQRLEAGDVEDGVISGLYEHARIIAAQLDAIRADHESDPTGALELAARRHYGDPQLDLAAFLQVRRDAMSALMTEARAALRVDGEGRYTTQKRVPAVGEPFEVAKVTAPATLSQACDDAASAMEVKSRARPLGGR